MFFIVILLRGTMSTFTKFITITSTALLMAAPLYASARGDLDPENAPLKWKLVYRPHLNSDKGKIEWSISGLANPSKGTVDLSACGDNTASSLRITTDLSNFFAVEKKNPKVNILIASHFLIKKYIFTTAIQFAQLLEDWNKDKAPVGIFWRWSGEDDLSRFDYLTSATLLDVASKNLYENWCASCPARPSHLFLCAPNGAYVPWHERRLSELYHIHHVTMFVVHTYYTHFMFAF